jgi:chromosome segregation ATPase
VVEADESVPERSDESAGKPDEVVSARNDKVAECDVVAAHDQVVAECDRAVITLAQVVAELMRVTAERDEVAAELKRVTAERDEAVAEVERVTAEHDETAAELRTAKATIGSHQARARELYERLMAHRQMRSHIKHTVKMEEHGHGASANELLSTALAENAVARAAAAGAPVEQEGDPILPTAARARAASSQHRRAAIFDGLRKHSSNTF